MQYRNVDKNGNEEIIPVDRIQKGDILRVLPGETVPVDGVILEGETSVDQSVMTGESLPVDKTVGDTLFSGTINRFGTVDFRAVKVGEDSALQRLVRMVSEAEEKQAAIAEEKAKAEAAKKAEEERQSALPKITKLQPQLVSPKNEYTFKEDFFSEEDKPKITFTWKPVDTAMAYRFILKNSEGKNLIVATVKSNKYILSDKISVLSESGTYEWSVTAMTKIDKKRRKIPPKNFFIMLPLCYDDIITHDLLKGYYR